MHARRLKNALLLVALGSGLVLGCELIVDFDRTKIPVDDAGVPDVDGSPPIDAGDSGQDTGTETGASDADAGTNDASDASDASDAADG